MIFQNIMSSPTLQPPFIANHPDEMLKDELKEREMTQKQLAELAGIPASVISEIIHGKRSLSKTVALAL